MIIIKFDLHIHSSYSDGLNSPGEIIRAAIKKGLHGISITDHDTIEGSIQGKKIASKYEDFQFIPGLEISSRDGHILALGIEENITSNLSAAETIERIRELGGVAIAVHPYDKWRHGVKALVKSLPFDAIEVFNARSFLGDCNRRAKKIAESEGIAQFGGSDAHWIKEIGYGVIVSEGDILTSIKSGKCLVRGNVIPIEMFAEDKIRRFLGLG